MPNSLTLSQNDNADGSTRYQSRILAIETSCDETAAAVIDNGKFIRSNIVASQIDMHQQYGGVFPEMASRAHVEAIVPTVQQAMAVAGASWESLSAVAVTRGPGLPGSLVVGVNAAKGISLARGLPLIGVNHLEGHIYSHWLTQDLWAQSGGQPPFPVIALIVSGGHTELILMRGHGQYELVGHTVDDAAGEAFDKVARSLGLGYPGGSAIEKLVQESGDPQRFKFSRPKVSGIMRGDRKATNYGGAYDFSFSGTKTAVLNLIQEQGGRKDGQLLPQVPVADIAAGFQESVVEWLTQTTARAVEAFGAKTVLVGGGVSANKVLRERMQGRLTVPVSFPPLALCTDNAAMIGAAAHFAFVRGLRDTLEMDVAPDLKLGN